MVSTTSTTITLLLLVPVAVAGVFGRAEERGESNRRQQASSEQSSVQQQVGGVQRDEVVAVRGKDRPSLPILLVGGCVVFKVLGAGARDRGNQECQQQEGQLSHDCSLLQYVGEVFTGRVPSGYCHTSCARATHARTVYSIEGDYTRKNNAREKFSDAGPLPRLLCLTRCPPLPG